VSPVDATLAVDWRRCTGHGVCAAAVPELVSRDRWGFPDLGGADRAPVPPELRAAARWAVASCPAAALALRRG